LRAVVQRVRSARVTARAPGSDGARELVGEMSTGLLCLVGVAPGDGTAQVDALAQKLIHLRVFGDDQGRMNHSLLEIGGVLGVVSQFTLYGDTRKGRRPFFGGAAEPAHAEPLLERLCAEVRAAGVPVVGGRFGADMEVDLVNVGPVTLILDTDDWERV
jgi:D-tyrosyl-tRNA(Tyr) deacylase